MRTIKYRIYPIMLPLLLLFIGWALPHNLQFYNPVSVNVTQINHTFTAIPIPNTAYLVNGATPNGDWYQMCIEYDYSAKGWAYSYEYWDNQSTTNYTEGWAIMQPIKNYSKVMMSFSISGNYLTINWHEANASQFNITYIEPINQTKFIPMKWFKNTGIFTGTMTEMDLPWLG